MSRSERSPVQVVPDVHTEPWCTTRWLILPCTTVVVAPARASESASVRTATYVLHVAASWQPSDAPAGAQSSLPMYAMAIRPASPAVTAGKTALVTVVGLMRAFGVQTDAGRPPRVGLLCGSSIGETERYTAPPVTQTA